MAAWEKRRREERSERLAATALVSGRQGQGGARIADSPRRRRLLTGAGYYSPRRLAVLYGIKIRGPPWIGSCFSPPRPAIAAALDLPRNLILLIGVWGVVLGWIAPTFIPLASRANRRKKEMLRPFPMRSI
jgi:hypothetical protein